MAYKDNAWGFMATSYDATIDREGAKAGDYLLIRQGGTEDVSRDIYQDTRFNDYIQLAYDIKKMAISFWNVAPRYWLKFSGPHAQYTMKNVSALTDDEHPIVQKILSGWRNGNAWKNGVSLHGFVFDVEEYSFWTDGGPVTDSWITFYINDIWERLQRMMDKGNIPPLKFGCYGRKLFIDDKCPSLNTFLGNRPEWDIFPAEWLSGPDGIAPLADIRKIRPPDTVTVNGVVKPYVPRLFGWSAGRAKQWNHWQFLGDAPGAAAVWKSNQVLTATGGPRPICAQMYNGTVEEMYADYKFNPDGAQPPPPPVDPGESPTPPSADLTLVLENQLAMMTALSELGAKIDRPGWLA